MKFEIWAALILPLSVCIPPKMIQHETTQVDTPRAEQQMEQQVFEVFRDRLAGAKPLLGSGLSGLAHHLIQLCHYYHFDPTFVLAMIEVESGFRTDAVSPAGAMGLMQLMPSVAAQITSRQDIDQEESARLLSNPFTNLTIGIAYLDWLRRRYQGRSLYYTVAAYNIGPAKMDELLSRKDFKPVKTIKYYEAIQRQTRLLKERLLNV